MATCALNGAHVLVLERVRIGQSVGLGGCWGLRRQGGREKGEWRELGSPVQSQFFGKQQLRGRIEGAFSHGQGCSRRRQLRGAYTTTEKIVGGLQQQKKEPGKRRLILLRHAKSSWADRSLKGNCESPVSVLSQCSCGLISIRNCQNLDLG